MHKCFSYGAPEYLSQMFKNNARSIHELQGTVTTWTWSNVALPQSNDRLAFVAPRHATSFQNPLEMSPRYVMLKIF